MGAIVTRARPLLLALASTGAAVLAFALLRGIGCGPDLSIMAAMILAGSLNIRSLVSLKDDLVLPTSRQALGEH
ncbi:MAG TPA: hypothetical protein VNU97_18330 [Rhizomicrobium sp.]|nr:hypothetical protein [Rhizomicrobium sp.]